MLQFQTDTTDVSDASIENVEPRFKRGRVSGVPTGLFVAGFLTNIAMLPVDSSIDDMVKEARTVAHFRFVDDHVVLAYDFDRLCNWVLSYQETLNTHRVGPEVNTEKYAPESLGRLISIRSKIPPDEGVRSQALQETRIDVRKSSVLSTKTLGQVSLIAAIDPITMDDDDLEDVLKRLEWLLLADIPAQELRPYTRAAFAAGRIATLAPLLIPEVEGIVDAARSLSSEGTRDDRLRFEALESRQQNEEILHLRYHFGLLLRAMQNFPENQRLFGRLHQYCRITGYSGLSRIGAWISGLRSSGFVGWGDYYAGLWSQLLAVGVLQAFRRHGLANGLRSERAAALQHLKDVADLPIREMLVPRDRERWFHRLTRQLLGVVLSTMARAGSSSVGNGLCARFALLAADCVDVELFDEHDCWHNLTGRDPGVWANFVESRASSDPVNPSPAWQQFALLLQFGRRFDRRACRRYPAHLSDALWGQLIQSRGAIKQSDSGWLRDAIGEKWSRLHDARTSRNRALNRAARSYNAIGNKWMTLAGWTEFVSEHCSPFDPRGGEWTALEIVRQLVETSFSSELIPHFSPYNVLIRLTWKNKYPANEGDLVSWEQWRSYAKTHTVRLRNPNTSIIDYRYFPADIPDLNTWDRRLVALGRLLVGILSADHRSPPLWNFRGNEQALSFPFVSISRSVAISTATTLLLESCISPRSAETRTIVRIPMLFGWDAERRLNDADLDAPLLQNKSELLQYIEYSQTILEKHQIAVAGSQPRQLVPFRLSRGLSRPMNHRTHEEVLDFE